MSESKRLYYHGGPAGLTEILPPIRTGALSGKAAARGSGLDTRHVREDRVFLTTSTDAAALFASSTETPTIYRVVPRGPVREDPDCSEPGLSWQCSRATVLYSRRLTVKEVERCRRVLFGVSQ